MADDALHSSPDSNSQNLKENPAGNEVLNGTNGNHKHYAADPEAQEMVIESLRTQIQDLFSQVTQLNSKLVKSYDRVSDLEDELHVASAQLRSSSVKISQLELERTQHLAALNTGLLVEKDHVTTELNRLMEKATEEAAQRGQAESARAAIEKELDDLSASLFNQANTMVAEARYAQAMSQRKAEDAEQALRGAEEAVSAMQQQVQTLQEEKEVAEKQSAEIQSLMGKGKWVDRRDSQPLAPTLRLFSFHLPYQEFLSFVTHLRHLHLSSPNPPAMSTLLPLPFLTRLSSEDSEPTVRLDLAPSLNWLSRRSVLAAIHTGQLTIEPMSFTTLLMESSHLSNAGISGTANNEYIPCALCGTSVFPQAPSANTSPTRPPTHPLKGMAHSYSGSGSSWSASIFKKTSSSSGSMTSGPPSVPPRSNVRTTQGLSNTIYPSQIYIFRISPSQTSSLPQLPLLKSSASVGPSGSSTPPSSHQNTPSLSHSSVGSGSPSQSSSTIYPLCTSGWCLSRLRTTCSMWAFVRTSIIERVWEEELPVIISPPVPNRAATSTPVSANSSNSVNGSAAAEKPPIPPRKRGLWGLASAIGERAASWSESSSEKAKRLVANTTSEMENKSLPPPHPPQERPAVPASETTMPTSFAPSTVPPPLPKRNEGRTRTPVNAPLSTSHSTSTVSSAEVAPVSVPPQLPSPSPEIRSSSPVAEAAISKDQPVQSPLALPTSTSEPASVTVAPLSTPPQTPTRPQGPPIPPRAVKRLSASFARPGTPSNIPLPESRPGTPPVVTNQPPSRTSSPALGSSPVATNGTPPPIPRRAAARAPRKPIGDSGGDNSRPGSPAVLTSLPRVDDVQAQATGQPQPQLNSVKEAADESKDEKKESEGSSTPKAPEAPKAIEHELSIQSNVSAFSEAEVFVDAEEGTQQEDLKEEVEVRTVKEDKEPKEAHEKTGGDIAKETKQEEVIGTPEEKEGTVTSSSDQKLSPVASDAAPALPPRRSNLEKKAEQDEADGVNGSTKEGPSENDEHGEHMYVSGTTWEEKTWKELTKLREEMFWARIGAIRS